MPIQQRGPFLLVFALEQQLGTLLHKTMDEGAPLTPSDFAVYSALRLEQPTTPTRLAHVLGTPPTTLSYALRQMSERGHLKRKRNPRDGRSSIISLTASGLRATEACFPAFEKAISTFRKHLATDEKKVLRELEAMSAALAKTLEEFEAAEDEGRAAL